MTSLQTLKDVVQDLELLREIRNQLDDLRLLHEDTRTTFHRILNLARTVICPDCRGYGVRGLTGTRTCERCNGTGALVPLLPRLPFQT